MRSPGNVIAVGLMVMLGAGVAWADPPRARPGVGQSSEWMVLVSNGVAGGYEGPAVPFGVETTLRSGRFLVGADGSYQQTLFGGSREQVGVWAGGTTGETTRWEFGLGAGWHGYQGVGHSCVVFCNGADPGASGSTAYLGQRVGLRWRGHNRATWTMGLWLYVTEDLSRDTVSYTYRSSAGLPLFDNPGPYPAMGSHVVGEVNAGLTYRVGFSLGE